MLHRDVFVQFPRPLNQLLNRHGTVATKLGQAKNVYKYFPIPAGFAFSLSKKAQS